jgi:phosphoribosylaminoimidazolecarboxamide formyltransferase/IMP cyclohydrolase
MLPEVKTVKITVPEGFNTKPLFPKSVFFSVHNSEKPGLEDHARALIDCGVANIFASGGTAKYLTDHGITVIDFNKEITGKPPIMNGPDKKGHRVATLGFESAGAILARRNDLEHMRELREYCRGIAPEPATFDIVAVSIYPFEQTVSAEEVDLLNAVENIDIGGPTLLREAAKNFEWVLPVPGMKWMTMTVELLRKGKGISSITRALMAAKTFVLISDYDAAIANFMSFAYGTILFDHNR